MWQFSETVDGIAEACHELEIPITGGNVSLYNETDGQSIYPTPVLGVVGLLADAAQALTRAFPEEGLDIVLLGDASGALDGSEYLKAVHGLVRGRPAAVDLCRERHLQMLLVGAARDELLMSAHDCAEGGFAVTLAECCFESGGVGARVELPSPSKRDDGFGLVRVLFGEAPSRVVVSVLRSERDSLLERARAASVPAAMIGKTGGDRLMIAVGGVDVADIRLDEAESSWANGFSRHLETVVD